MSIIGTRPPLISETNFYELHHRAIVFIIRKDIKDAFKEGEKDSCSCF